MHFGNSYWILEIGSKEKKFFGGWLLFLFSELGLPYWTEVIKIIAWVLFFPPDTKVLTFCLPITFSYRCTFFLLICFDADIVHERWCIPSFFKLFLQFCFAGRLVCICFHNDEFKYHVFWAYGLWSRWSELFQACILQGVLDSM